MRKESEVHSVNVLLTWGGGGGVEPLIVPWDKENQEILVLSTWNFFDELESKLITGDLTHLFLLTACYVRWILFLE